MSGGQIIGYVRVSAADQSLARQLDGIHTDEVFQDKVSAKDTNRPALLAMITHARKGDVVLVHSIDRLARNLVDLRSLVTKLNAKGVTVSFAKEGLSFSSDVANPMSMLMLNMMGAFAEFERSMIRERQREGIAAAKAAGRPTGRPPRLNKEAIRAIRQRCAEGTSKATLAAEFNVSRATVYAALK